MCDKRKTISIQQENIKDIQTSIKNQEVLKSVNDDYGEYVAYRLNNIHNTDVEFEIKLEIDLLFCNKIK